MQTIQRSGFELTSPDENSARRPKIDIVGTQAQDGRTRMVQVIFDLGHGEYLMQAK